MLVRVQGRPKKKGTERRRLWKEPLQAVPPHDLSNLLGLTCDDEHPAGGAEVMAEPVSVMSTLQHDRKCLDHFVWVSNGDP